MTASSTLTSLRSPKASTLRRVKVGFQVAAYAAFAVAVACSFVAPPLVAGVLLYAFYPTLAAWAASIILYERKEHTNEVATLKTEVATLRQYRSQELAA